jgi:glycosyltransferase involved in cell wall biosynthesis
MGIRVRALHVIAGNLWGGIETFLFTLARSGELAPEMHSEFAICFDGRLRKELTSLGTPLCDLGPVRSRYPWLVLRARRVLAARIRQGSYDVVVCHSAWSQAIFGGVPQRLGVPAVFYLHDLVRPRYWLERWAGLHRPDLAITNSEFTKSTLPGLYANLPCSVVRYPIPAPPGPPSLEERRALRRELGADDDTAIIVQACRMQPWKGHERLLRALATLPRDGRWLCLIAGGAQREEERVYRAGLEAQSRALGISERVRFLGQRSDVPRLFSASDIHCQANATPEPFGIAFVEALAAGLPVLTFDMGGAREIVTSEVGYLAADDAELGRRLKELVEDRALRQRLGQAGPERARELCDPARQLGLLSAELARVARARKAS